VTWAKVDDSFSDHPKVDLLPDEVRLAALGAWVLALSHAAKHLTDGLVLNSTLHRLGVGESERLALVAARLWEEGDGGIVIHDFLVYNFSRERVEQKRAQQKSAGRLGGKARGRSDRNETSDGRQSESVSGSLRRKGGSAARPRPVPARGAGTGKRISNPQIPASDRGPDFNARDLMRELGVKEEIANGSSWRESGEAQGRA